MRQILVIENGVMFSIFNKADFHMKMQLGFFHFDNEQLACIFKTTLDNVCVHAWVESGGFQA